MKAVTYDTDPELAYIYVLPPKKNGLRSLRSMIVSCWISAKTAKSPDSNVLVRQHTSVPHLPGNPGYM
ncbi:hypothetical protein NRS6085_17965 [Bacillus subtilis]|nr:hypothetical protein NRS6085_03566 [Bacillus subtilis]CAI6309134.1 hypothetical protein NRS6085_17965 [Bacillus subtilis]